MAYTDLPFGAGYPPETGFPRMGNNPIVDVVPVVITVSNSVNTTRTMTAAEVLGGLWIINCDDANTATLPTAALLNAAIPGVRANTVVFFDIINIGDATLTIAVGTGGTLVVGNSKSTVATIAAAASKRFMLRVTAVKQIDGSDAYMVLSFGSVAASVA